ncbi:MAG: hypothetical protein R3268_00440 [Acidiferrobacterales bacterium]|nr:hypothetical protein [Acidiferrobacterales bacterium]
MRLQIDYFDHNEHFARYLPRTGTAVRELRDARGTGPWLLLDLDEPFEYQLKVAEPCQFRLARVNAFLIRCRWHGQEVGDPEGVSVFLLLVEEGQHPKGDVIDPKAFVHIAWGMCRPEKT